MAVTAAHVLLYTPEPERLRGVFRDVFGWRHVDNGDGWLIFALPAAELGVHPSEGATHHELCFMCDEIESTLAELRERGIDSDEEPRDMGFGIATTLALPGGVRVLLYEPRHATPLAEL